MKKVYFIISLQLFDELTLISYYIKGIPKQKNKCFFKIGPCFCEFNFERAKFQLLFLQKLFPINGFSWEPPFHFFPFQFTIFLHKKFFLHFILIFFCVSHDETQINCKWNAKKFMKRKKNCKMKKKKINRGLSGKSVIWGYLLKERELEFGSFTVECRKSRCIF